MKISLIIPIGIFPFFVNANIKNIQETCGLPLEKFDLIFLVEKNNKVFMSVDIRGFNNFKVIESPNIGGEHLKILDWFIYSELVNTDWVIIQHSDVFWHNKAWLIEILDIIHRETNIATITAYPKNGNLFYSIKGKEVLTLHDIFAVYKRSEFINRNLTLKRGRLLKDVMLSPKLINLIKNKDIIKTKNSNKEIVTKGYTWLDGSHAISLELAHCPKVIHKTNFSEYYHHFSSFFRLASLISYDDNILKIDSLSSFGQLKNLLSYAQITTKFFNKDQFRHKILPMKIMRIIASEISHDYRAIPEHIMNMLTEYTHEKNTISENDNMGIKGVSFKDKFIKF